mgnify:CR=1 FL=1
MLWMSAATFFFAISFTLVKALQDDGLTVYQAVFFRQTLGIVIFFPMLITGGVAQFKTVVPMRHFLRAALGFIGMCTGYYSLSMINVADSVALQFTLPFFTMGFAIWVLGEKIYSHRLIATLVGFFGVLIIVRPGFTDLSYGIVFALAAAAFHAISDTCLLYTSPSPRDATLSRMPSSA